MIEMWTYHVVVCDNCSRPADADIGPVGEVSMGEAMRIAEGAGFHIDTTNRALCPMCQLHLDDDQLTFPL